MYIKVIIGFLLLSGLVGLVGFNDFGNPEIDFNNEIRTVLGEKCLECHGGVRQESDLSFLFPETAVAPAKSGRKAIVPGRAKHSELIRRVTSTDPDLRMPPEGEALSKEEIKTFRDWINQGAKWSVHWSFIPLDTALILESYSFPDGQHTIDHIVRKKLSELGVSHSQAAPKETLLRRVSLDLTGLPPSEELTTSFLTDESKDAYENLIDQLLDSPHFGERWAVFWLDLARYADSRGYQKDLLRPEMWKYRDWVIHALNEDKPFDQFTIEQIAGDLLPNPEPDQILATAFHRNTMTNDEGGTDDEEFRVTAVIDRVNTTMEIWQSSTVACVQCHSHPYDPIRHEEYYNLMAFFNNTEDADHYSDGPTRKLLSPAQAQRLAVVKEELEVLKSNGDTLRPGYVEGIREMTSIFPSEVPIMRELPVDSSRITHVFERGNWLVHGSVVQPDVPEYLPEFDPELPKNRLGLAQWLMVPENPLTARVMVNRLWEQVFGRGLVPTLEDFGIQGDQPAYPELLDWLATRFMTDHQWSIKQTLKEIMLSETYRQSSHITPELLQLDPENELLARGPRFRLSAEQIRDQALSVSGLLNPEVYGKSVMPYQPEGVWNVIRHVAQWDEEDDDQRYRRGLYTFWRRVSPYPSMLTFDAPSREFCKSRRIRTNTPLQALTLLNDPVYVEAAKALGTRMMNNELEEIDQKIAYGYQLALIKPPKEEILNELLGFYRLTLEQLSVERESVRWDDESASLESLALQQVASVILNLDDMMMKS